MTAIAHVITESVYVRDKPHKDADVIGALKKGDKLPILDKKTFAGGYVWVQVRLKNMLTGWIYAGPKYVTIASNVPDVEPPHIPVPDVIEWKPILWLGGLAVALIAFLFLVTVQ